MKYFINGMIFTVYALMCLVNTFGSIEIAGFSFSDKLAKRIGFSILFGVLALIPVYETFLKGN